MAVTKLSLDDINQVRASSNNEVSFSAASSQPEKKPSGSFVGRLTDEQITKFFKPYGLISFERMVDNGEVRGIYAKCIDFICSFSDFDVIVWPIDDVKDLENSVAEYVATNNEFPQFNMESFKLYCESIETTPERAIESRISSELLGGLKKYNEKYSEFVPKRLDEKFADVPEEYKALLKSAKDDQLLIAKKDELLKILEKYGSFENIEALMARSNQ